VQQRVCRASDAVAAAQRREQHRARRTGSRQGTVLHQAWRARSLVECLNSVARMQQSRHGRMTPGLLALKRLYGNCRTFRTGRRRPKTPYGLLGVRLPTQDWWALLKLTPVELRQQLSALGVAP
jgi:hypothetical protein